MLMNRIILNFQKMGWKIISNLLWIWWLMTYGKILIPIILTRKYKNRDNCNSLLYREKRISSLWSRVDFFKSKEFQLLHQLLIEILLNPSIIKTRKFLHPNKN